MIARGCCGLLIFVDFGFQPNYEGLKASIQPVDFHEASSIVHGPADVPTHGVEQVLLGDGLGHAGPLTGALEAFNLNLDTYVSHNALGVIT